MTIIMTCVQDLSGGAYVALWFQNISLHFIFFHPYNVCKAWGNWNPIGVVFFFQGWIEQQTLMFGLMRLTRGSWDVLTGKSQRDERGEKRPNLQQERASAGSDFSRNISFNGPHMNHLHWFSIFHWFFACRIKTFLGNLYEHFIHPRKVIGWLHVWPQLWKNTKEVGGLPLYHYDIRY